MKNVLCFGTFDGVHPGHIHFLKQCKKQGEYLTVVIARDSTVRDVKHHAPRFSEQKRLDAVRKVPDVNHAVLGNPDDKYKVIQEVKPDIICLGYDQKVFVDKLAEKLRGFGIKPRILRMQAYKPDIYKSSIMKKRTSSAIRVPGEYKVR